MAVRKILTYYEHNDPLREVSQPIQHFDRNLSALIRDLKDTLKANPDGIGLAAPQINVHLRVVIVCLDGQDVENHEPGSPQALINPKILAEANERKAFDGCLSFPGLFGDTTRPHYLRVTGFDENGESFERIFNYKSLGPHLRIGKVLRILHYLGISFSLLF